MDLQQLTDEQLTDDVVEGVGRPLVLVDLNRVEAVPTERESAQRLLLDDDPALRREAFAFAVGSRWVDHSGQTTVRAVQLDAGAGSVKKRALARAVPATTQSSTIFIGENGGFLYFATSSRAAHSDVDAQITALGRRFGAPVAAIGVAVLSASDSDLSRAAQQASCAARLVAALPELGPVANYAELGSWMLVSQIPPGSVRIEDVSPAAEVLLRRGNELYRETVEVYLDATGRNSVACERLHIHRTTLYYRLDNAPALVREALRDGVARSSLHLALKLHRLWNAKGSIE
jgi:sugar diacid utilization regulator